jgi:uncharacterized repeat protein (TIGR03803 family)
LWNFTCGNDGCSPEGGVVLDAAGNLYGTTFGGGPGGSGYGTVYKLSPGSNGTWTETTLHVFTGRSDGADPTAGVILDHSGNIYGTAAAGGASSCQAGNYIGCGVIFELIPADNVWKEQVLYNFTGKSDGSLPYAQLTFDSAGNLYGTAGASGNPSCSCGTVFRLAAPASVGDSWTFSALHTFTGGSDGGSSVESVLLDHAGAVYGTATLGGQTQGVCMEFVPAGCGTVFRLIPTQDGGWSFELLYSFLGKGDGETPFGIVFGPGSTIYGATGEGGYRGGNCHYVGGCGTIFELTSP